MSIEAIKWALSVGRNVPPAARHVLLVLANYANADGRAWPSAFTLAEDTGLDIRTVRRCLAQLRSASLLVILQPACGVRPTTYGLALYPWQSATPGITPPLALRHPSPGNRSATPGNRSATPGNTPANPYEPYEPPNAGARATLTDAPPARDQSPKSGTLSRADRLAMLPPEIRNQLARKTLPNDRSSAALAEIEARRLQAARFVSQVNQSTVIFDNAAISAERSGPINHESACEVPPENPQDNVGLVGIGSTDHAEKGR